MSSEICEYVHESQMCIQKKTAMGMNKTMNTTSLYSYLLVYQIFESVDESVNVYIDINGRKVFCSNSYKQR